MTHDLRACIVVYCDRMCAPPVPIRKQCGGISLDRVSPVWCDASSLPLPLHGHGNGFKTTKKAGQWLMWWRSSSRVSPAAVTIPPVLLLLGCAVTGCRVVEGSGPEGDVSVQSKTCSCDVSHRSSALPPWPHQRVHRHSRRSRTLCWSPQDPKPRLEGFVPECMCAL